MIIDSTSDLASASIDPPAGIVLVKSVDEARQLSRNYTTRADTPRVPVTAVYVDRLQMQAMQLLMEANPDLSGCRIIFASEDDGSSTAVVVGVDEGLNDQTDTIYKTASPVPGPCPPMCDIDSPITGA